MQDKKLMKEKSMDQRYERDKLVQIIHFISSTLEHVTMPIIAAVLSYAEMVSMELYGRFVVDENIYRDRELFDCVYEIFDYDESSGILLPKNKRDDYILDEKSTKCLTESIQQFEHLQKNHDVLEVIAIMQMQSFGYLMEGVDLL